MMLFGHYDQIPCDSEVCSYFKLPPNTPQAWVKAAIIRRHRKWGKFVLLAFKFERILSRTTTPTVSTNWKLRNLADLILGCGTKL